MKIAVVRGPSLNEWEMQNYLPLGGKHKLLAIGSKMGPYELESKIRTKKLLCLGEIFNFVPGGIKFLYRSFGDPQVLLGLEKATAGFDIVHTAECSNYYSFQALKARRRGLVKKLVVTCWENLVGLHEDYPEQRKIKSEVIREADHFLAVTEQAKRVLVADGVRPEKITVIPMGVDLNKFKNHESRIMNHGQKEMEILFVGRLVEEKGVLDLLEVFKVVNEQVGGGVNLRLRMVGSGPLRGRLVKQIQGWGISDKVIIEEKNYSEMPKVYQNADLFVLPSKLKEGWEEQFGMALVEAMACGLPVVTTRTGAIPEVVGGVLPAGRQAGILVEPGNVPQLTRAIMRVISDGKLRTSLSLKWLKRVQDSYDCQKVALKIESLYTRLIRRSFNPRG